MAVQTQTLPVIESVDGVRRFTIKEYHKIYETGIFEGQRVELLNGMITVMFPMNNPHLGMVGRLTRMLNIRFANEYFVSPQCPLKILQNNEPEPDIVIAKARDDDYMNSSIPPEDVLLIIEIADSSLKRDRNQKKVIYAKTKIREYWIINLQDRQIETFENPQNGDYQIKNIIKAGETVVCEYIDLQISVDELFKNLKS